MALLGATAAVLLGGGSPQGAEAFSFLRVPRLLSSTKGAGGAAAGAGTEATRPGAPLQRGGGRGGARGAVNGGSSSGSSSGRYIGTGGKWIRPPATRRGGLLLQLGAKAAAAAAVAEERQQQGQQQQQQEEEREDGLALSLLDLDVGEEQGQFALLVPSLAGAGAGGGSGGGGGGSGGGGSFRVFAESGHAPAVPAFLASAWSSLRGDLSPQGLGLGQQQQQMEVEPLLGSYRMMDEGSEEEKGEEGEEEGGGSVVLSAPHLLAEQQQQQPPSPLPSVMEPSPPAPKPDFNRNDNFTINVSVLRGSRGVLEGIGCCVFFCFWGSLGPLGFLLSHQQHPPTQPYHNPNTKPHHPPTFHPHNTTQHSWAAPSTTYASTSLYSSNASRT
jgi:hypothetical protein